MKSAIFPVALLCLAGAFVLLTTGCESTSTAEEVITVTPASASLDGKGDTASFVASATSTNSPLVLPLEWNLDRGDLGRIISAVGLTAVYESNGKVGNNTITVKDQVGQAGVAVINQIEPITNAAVAATAEPVVL